jgi:hypothetical protein
MEAARCFNQSATQTGVYIFHVCAKRPLAEGFQLNLTIFGNIANLINGAKFHVVGPCMLMIFGMKKSGFDNQLKMHFSHDMPA